MTSDALAHLVGECLTWEEALPSDGPWKTWVYAAVPDGRAVPAGFELTTAGLVDANLVRTSVPSLHKVADTLRAMPLLRMAEAVVVLVRGHVALAGVPPRPVLLPADESWPQEGELPPRFMASSGSWPAVVAFALDQHGSSAILARTVDAERAARSGMFRASASLADAVVDLQGSGLALEEPHEHPGVFMRYLLTGDSGLSAGDLPDTSLVLLACYLGHLVDVLELHGPGVEPALWQESVDSVREYSVFSAWESLQHDQLHERFLGEWVRTSDAALMDPGMFAITLMTAVPSPEVYATRLAELLSSSQRRQVNRALKRHKAMRAWLPSKRV